MECKTDVSISAQLPDDIQKKQFYSVTGRGEMRLEYPATETGSSGAGHGVGSAVLTFNLIIEPAEECVLTGCSTPKGCAKSNPTGEAGWWTCEQAAEHLGLSPKTIREGAAKGTLPGHKYPLNSKRGRWRFRRDELDSWLTKKPTVRKTKGVAPW